MSVPVNVTYLKAKLDKMQKMSEESIDVNFIEMQLQGGREFG